MIAAAVAFLAGCAATRKTTADRSLLPGQIFSHVRDRNARVQTLQGDGLLTVESPEGSHNGSFDVRVKKPDSVRIELRGPFGVQAGTLLLSRDTFLYYNRLENVAFTGKPNGRTLRSMFRLTMRFDEVMNALTGEFPVAGDGDSLLAAGADDRSYHFRYRAGGEIREYDVDGESFIVTGYRVFDKDGKEVLSAESSRIRMSDSIPLPKLLRVVFPEEKRSVTIAYDDITINRPTECAFTLPRQAEVITKE